MPSPTLETHNGFVTITNPSTGKHRTFRVRTEDWDGDSKRVVALITGPSRKGNDARSFAFVTRDGSVRVWQKHQGTDMERLATMLESPGRCRAGGLRYEWSVRCRRCNRELTTPESIESGIGPVCGSREMRERR